MRILFWVAAALVLYTYVGYPAWLYVRSRRWPRPVCCAESSSSVSIILAARNEERNLPAKLANLAELEYPGDVDIIAVSDGSTDATAAILRSHAGPHLQVFVLAEPGGKAVALNLAMEAAQGDIVVFTDARQRLDRAALIPLLAPFADPSVGAVSGELELAGGADHALGLYWRLEKQIRQWESESGSAVGATGALYAVRRTLLSPLPAGTILDDVLLPARVVRQGKRVLFAPNAKVYDQLGDNRHEFRRKVRTLTGNYQLLQLAPWLLGRANPLRFEFFCHKLLRLAIPFALAAMLLASFALSQPIYRVAFVLQAAFYALAAFARSGRRLPFVGRVAAFSNSFLLLNSAAAMALFYFLARKRTVWTR